MTSTKNKPVIDTSRFNELLNQPQEVPAFAQPEKVEIQNHSLVCISPSRIPKGEDKDTTAMSFRMSKELVDLLDKHTAGSRNTNINKLAIYAIKDLLNKNITIK